MADADSLSISLFDSFLRSPIYPGSMDDGRQELPRRKQNRDELVTRVTSASGSGVAPPRNLYRTCKPITLYDCIYPPAPTSAPSPISLSPTLPRLPPILKNQEALPPKRGP
eukprot:scaffold30665_cov36-Phaeocystis_antarctica.AAC.2